MVKTVSIKADGAYEINFGDISMNGYIDDLAQHLPTSLIAPIENIYSDMQSYGASEIHIEEDTFTSFVHVRKGSNVLALSIGDVTSADNFRDVVDNSMMVKEFLALKEAEAAAAEAAALAEAAAAAAAAQTQGA